MHDRQTHHRTVMCTTTACRRAAEGGERREFSSGFVPRVPSAPAMHLDEGLAKTLRAYLLQRLAILCASSPSLEALPSQSPRSWNASPHPHALRSLLTPVYTRRPPGRVTRSVSSSPSCALSCPSFPMQ